MVLEAAENIIRVLLCDDNDHFRQLLLQFLKSLRGIEVVGEASDGVDVIEKTESLEPHLILMDLSMPNQSGFDAAKTIKQRWPEKQVIMLTLYEDNIYRELADEYHTDGFVAKSAIKTDLPEILNQKRSVIFNH